MIIVRAPLRISFVGGGTDLHAFCRHSTGRVISVAIDKYVYVSINPLPLIKKVVARYSAFEVANHAGELKNDRIRAALLDLGIHNSIDITTFSHVPVKTGLGSSSSFSVALMKGLYAYLGKRIDEKEAAEAACRLEIDVLKQPIGKQDQYAAAYGGLNILQFNADRSVDVEPVFLDYKRRSDFENHILLFFTGITREASSVLTEQKAKTKHNLATLKQMAKQPLEFRDLLLDGDFKAMGELLHKGWLKKKTLASNISNPAIDTLYEIALKNGAWGGKILGAGGGGCLLMIADPKRKQKVIDALKACSLNNKLDDAGELPIKFVQSGVEIVSTSGFKNI